MEVRSSRRTPGQEGGRRIVVSGVPEDPVFGGEGNRLDYPLRQPQPPKIRPYSLPPVV